jgi:ribosomal protein S27AE
MMQMMGKSLESLKHEEKTKSCPDCGSEEIAYDKGEIFCKKCGLVMD